MLAHPVTLQLALDLVGVHVLAGQVPEVLRTELYAVPALLWATLVALAARWNALSTGVIWGCAGLVFAIRVLAVMLDLNAPMPLRTGDQ